MTVVATVTLPRLVGTREAASEVLRASQVPSDLSGVEVEVHARNLASGSTSFADELVKIVLADGGASRLVLLGAPDAFAERVESAARRRGVAAKVQTVTVASAG